MKRRHFLTSSMALAAVPVFSKDEPPGAQAAKETTKLDPALAAGKAGTQKLSWQNPEEFGLEGRVWEDLPRLRYYDRLPAYAQKTVTPAVWSLSRHSAGMMARFKSNATAVYVRYTLMSDHLALATMPATGVSGTDLYARDENGVWRWANVSKPDKKEVLAALSEGMTPQLREYALYLPLYNGVEKLEIGVNEGASFEGLAPRPRPIVFYGTSITHGAAASRPGMCHPAILGRRLDRPVVNLGFSGNGKMDAAVGEFLGKLDAAVFVIDCLPNMDAKLVRERCIPLVEQIRAARPQTPIVLVEDRRNTNSWLHADRARMHTANHEALRESFAKLTEKHIPSLFYVEGDHLLGEDGDGSTDGSHPSDLGFVRQADVFEPVLRKALEAGKA